MSFTHDALGRQLTETGAHGTMTSQYDPAGRRTRLTYPGGFYVTYDHLVTGEVTAMKENGTTALVDFAYDDLGRRTGLTYGDGSSNGYGYDAAGRLSSRTIELSGVSYDLTLGFSYNPAGQIAGVTRSNDLYSFVEPANQNRTDTHNGLNQVTANGGTSVSHDARGNTTAIGTDAFSYSSENLMTGQSGVGNALDYDPLTRLTRTAYGMQMAYDGLALIEEHNGAGLQNRYVHGPGMDEPLVWYDSAGTRRFLHADERGSIVTISQDGGTTFPGGLIYHINRYDEYGRPASNQFGRFGYTGQVWLPEHGLWYYKARMYNAGPAVGGRFMQTDPIGYLGGMNMYGYVGGDPVNLVDPTGMVSRGKVRCGNGSIELNDDRGDRCRGLGAASVQSSGLGALLFGGMSGGFGVGVGGDGGGSGGGPGAGAGLVAFGAANRQCPAVPSSRPVGRVGEFGAALLDPFGANAADAAADWANAESSSRFARMNPVNTQRDAYRHFLWVFVMARTIGANRALNFANAHEVGRAPYGDTDQAQRDMDTYNNHVAIAFYRDSNLNRGSAVEAANKAMESGCLVWLR